MSALTSTDVSGMMVPLAENRIRASLQDLKDFLATEPGVPAVSTS